MRRKLTKIDILGTEYKVFIGDRNEPDLQDADGICKQFDKELILRDKEYLAGDTDLGKEYRYSHVIRHELIHALAEESGVHYDEDEHLVDWIAHMIPILNKLDKEIADAHK